MPRPRSSIVSPGCVPGRTWTSSGPSSVGTSSFAPSAASGAGHVEHRDEVVLVADEVLVRLDRDEHVEVAGVRARLAGVAAAADADALALGDPGGHVDRDRVREHLAPAALAARARPLGLLAVAAADVAGDRARHLPERRAADGLQHAVAAAAVAGRDRRAGLGAVAAAALAAVDDLVVDVDRGARRRLLEVDLDRDLGVAAAARARRPAAEAAAAEERREEVVDRAEAVEVRALAAALEALVAVAVVRRAAIGVGQDLVGLGGLLELLLGLRVVAVDVGVQLARELAEGLLDLALVGRRGRRRAPRRRRASCVVDVFNEVRELQRGVADDADRRAVVHRDRADERDRAERGAAAGRSRR